MKKVLLFTSQDIGNDLVTFLSARDDIELAVVTQRTRRDEIYGYRATLDLCVERGIEVHTPKSLDDAFVTTVKRMAPDLLLCAYYPKIFPRRLIEIPPLGCINVHPGLLPHYRGTFPTPWCILNNEDEIGVTIHMMDASIDTGDILVQRRFPIGPDETGHELYVRSMKLCADLVIENFDALLRNEISPRPQPPGGSYYNRISPRYQIDWHQRRIDIRNQIRVHATPYFPAFSFVMNKCLTINKASLIDLPDLRLRPAGTICSVRDDMTFVVSCVDGFLLVEDFDLFPVLRPDDVALHIRVGQQL